MLALLQDLRYGLRTLARRPAFTAVAVAALALGIGANAAIFSLVDALVLRPPMADAPERVVNVHAVSRDGSGFHAFSYLDYRDYRADNPAFSELAAWSIEMVSLATGDEARVTVGQIVSESYFDVFGVEPVAGRFFAAEEGEGLDAHPVAVIGHDLWRTLGGDAGVVGRTIHVNDRAFTVLGVAPDGFTGAFGVVAPEIWVPLTMQPLVKPRVDLDNRRFVWLEVIGRLAPGVSPAEAEAFLDGRYRQLAAANPDDAGEGGIDLGAFGTMPGQIRGGVQAFMAVLMGIVGLLLLVTCVNVAGMLLARGAERRREIGVRLAIGAGRGRLVRQLVTESLLLFAVGGTAGTLVAHWASRLFLAVDLPIPVPLAVDLGVDPRVLGFTLAVTLVTGLVFGLAPALQATRFDLVSSLKDDAASDGPRRLRLRSALVVAQVAVALLLLIGAGLFLRALDRAASIDPGFRAEDVHLATLDLSLHGYGEETGASFFASLRERLAAMPDVEAASYARMVPLTLSNSTTGFNVPGHEPPADDSMYPADWNTVGVDYFRAMGIPLVAGRGFSASDRPGSPPVAVVNQTLAERFWPGDSAVGQRIVLGALGSAPEVEVVGVAADVKYRTLGEAPRFYLYVPLAQEHSPRMTLHVRARPGAAGVAGAVREAIRELDGRLPVAEATTLERAIGVSLLPQRVASTVTGIFGVLGLLLVGIGVYGVTAFAVSQRTREFGLRMALGARGADVLGLVLRQGMTLALIGIACGLAGAAAATRLLSSLLFGVSATDPWTFAAAAGVLAGIVVLGSLLPAWRATQVDPLRALRYE
jgi:predicted permease